jgi:hypothetical protein
MNGIEMTRPTPHGPRPRRGIFLADTMIGFALMALLSVMLVVAITRTHRAGERLDTSNASTRTARRVITLLQHGQPAPPRMDDAEIRINPAPGGIEVPGHAWVEVTVVRQKRPVTLVGLVPRKEAR